ncbi:unnamed protein product [Urochloa humidicola]
MSLLRFTGALGLDSQLDGLLSEATAEEDFTGKAEQSVVLRLAGQDFKRLSLIGLGQSAPSTAAVASESTAGILARTSWREPSSVARRLVPMFAGFRARCSAREGVARIRAMPVSASMHIPFTHCTHNPGPRKGNSTKLILLHCSLSIVYKYQLLSCSI